MGFRCTLKGAAATKNWLCSIKMYIFEFPMHTYISLSYCKAFVKMSTACITIMNSLLYRYGIYCRYFIRHRIY